MNGKVRRRRHGVREAKYLSTMARAAVTHRGNARRARAGAWGRPPEPLILEYADHEDAFADTIVRVYLDGEDPDGNR